MNLHYITSLPCRGEAIVSLESEDHEGVVEVEDVVEGPASKPWRPALMPSW